MSAPKRLRQPILTRESNFAASTSAFIEPILTPITNISQKTDNHLNVSNRKESSQANQLVNLQQQTSHFEQKNGAHDHFELISKTTTKNKHTHIIKANLDEMQHNGEDDWVLFSREITKVCPVAVALRRAGYNVPLRPSKSWLERDRKKQASLRERQMPSKEM